jgi:hypothetical protein
MADFLTHARQLYIPPSLYKITTGTWTLTSSSGILYQLKTATDETSTVSIPIALPAYAGEFGQKLKSIEVPLRITTADLDAVIAGTLYRVNDYLAVAAAGVDITATSVTITETGAAVTAAATDRLYTATISSPDWVYTSTLTKVHYQLDISLNCGATTVVRAYGATVNYDDLG